MNITGRYWNINGIAIAIVASITEDVDWSAYVGATTKTWREEDAVDWTLKSGAKLSRRDAEHFFPNIKLPYRD